MKCKYHPNREANKFCSICHVPLCDECAEELNPGTYTCFNCAMIRQLSEGGSKLTQRRSISQAKRKKRWGPFQYVFVLSCALIIVMWGVIIFGGRPSPSSKKGMPKAGKALLFMVDGAIKRYAHYEGNGYPDSLLDLIPKYLVIKDTELGCLKQLSYRKDPAKGYLLTLRQPKKDEAGLVLTAKGIEYMKAISGQGQ